MPVEHVAREWQTKVEPQVEEMKAHAQAARAADVPANYGPACSKYGGCPFMAKCLSGAFKSMSLRERLLKPSESPTSVEDELPAILPPDAPAPVRVEVMPETSEQPAPRRRGRPRKSSEPELPFDALARRVLFVDCMPIKHDGPRAEPLTTYVDGLHRKIAAAGGVDDVRFAGSDSALGGQRPDGKEFVDELQRVTCARQLASGLFHRWRYPDIGGVPQDTEIILRWLSRRQEFNREPREHLKHPAEHLDSPGLLVRAAIRAHQSPPYDGELPTWRAHSWPGWGEIHRQVVHVTECVWLSDFIVQDAARWALSKGQPGIVWVEFPELGERIAKTAGVPFCGGGPAASATIIRESGKRSIVASLRAHGTGKNLTMFSRMLFVNPPADGAAWEQAIGRCHRQGQLADEVEVELYQHTDELVGAFKKARDFTRFIEQTERTPQKPNFGRRAFYVRDTLRMPTPC
ncbi:P-loop NTPase family protein [Citreicoccus inhibens]|uniref:hypothetical protein n=1 Tax=Citreicoccus inhibens TaxID=2849499 RepID=UPI002E2AC428|nr:hypothetical protein [Citreicoccus inhibens]